MFLFFEAQRLKQGRVCKSEAIQLLFQKVAFIINSKMEVSKVIHSPYDLDISLPRTSRLSTFLWDRVKSFPHWEQSTFLTCGRTNRSFTYEETRRLSNDFSRALINILKLQRNEIVMIMLPNCIEYAIVCLGVIEAGCVVSLLNPTYKKDELEHVFKIVSPTCIIACLDNLPRILAMKDTTPSLQSVILLEGENPETFSYKKLCLEGSLISSAHDEDDKTFPQDAKDTALILYSSGTTGLPKAVMLSHLNICTSLMQMTLLGNNFTIHPFISGGLQEHLLVPLPLFHIMGIQMFILYGLVQGSHLIILPNFEKNLLIRNIRKHKPTVWQVVPPMLKYFVNSPEILPEDFASVQRVLSAAAPLGDETEKKFRTKFPTVKLSQAYGLTETCSIFLACGYKVKEHCKPGSVGVLFPGAVAKICDVVSREALGPNQCGELLVKGNQTMTGYLNNEEATRNTIGPEGWLHTGDIAKYDEDGCFFIVDRLKDVIKYKGYQVSPSEIENILRQLPNILDVAVVGVKCDDEELPKAFVVRKNDSLVQSDVIEHVRERLADFKQLRGGVEFVDKIPVNPSGKILRRNLNGVDLVRSVVRG